MEEIVVKSNANQLDNVLNVIRDSLDQYDVPIKNKLQLELVIEEIFVNISSYAYDENVEGEVKIQYIIKENPLSIKVSFIDSGIEFNPLNTDNPDIEASADERNIGGLGLFIVKKNIDDIYYEYKNNQNILTIIKIL